MTAGKPDITAEQPDTHELPDRETRLAVEEHGWFASIRPNGSPHLVPVWFLHHAEHLWITTSERSRKARNLVGEPRVSLAIDGTTPHSLVAEGTAVLAPFDPEGEVATMFRSKYTNFDREVGALGGPLALIDMTVTRWLLDGSRQ
ncbi:Pyridoxamine 5'-phosphate oxidase [Rathayibacter oskolensis]|uniref:Pyridoxamine 5'-phosphate oxidase n=1 Tax=Rathayibacter oskolensis TaxID=1891671 RepID=A0A1X7P080_9MICO|nr:pyridoxamine 5'-phosphate oxidase family protein [Rathayibacter oskolensis]SMH43998.1 Pyridoxamine 5'-phosphate oxidase [Rathayibacter oskolensis]